jgi:hypothetical protein
MLRLTAGAILLLLSQGPTPLGARDLTVASVVVDSDTATVLESLGRPPRTDSTGWHYGDLHVFFRDGRVAIVSLTGAAHATARGLRVGDPVERVRQLYRSCFDDATLYQICWPAEDFDERAITISLRAGRVHRINVGRIMRP